LCLGSKAAHKRVCWAKRLFDRTLEASIISLHFPYSPARASNTKAISDKVFWALRPYRIREMKGEMIEASQSSGRKQRSPTIEVRALEPRHKLRVLGNRYSSSQRSDDESPEPESAHEALRPRSPQRRPLSPQPRQEQRPVSSLRPDATTAAPDSPPSTLRQ